MHRCISLARLGAGSVAPNPMVGAVLVHQDRIIGEGYHQQYGKAHAEVNCIHSVAGEHRGLIPLSTLYVSLEPCSHFGKTPPCTDLIIAMKIPIVVIGCRDPFSEVDGKGIEKLKAAGIEVEEGILKEECIDLNSRFFTFHTIGRPYFILKWAQTTNGKIANKNSTHLAISNGWSNRLVHKWRSEEAAILVGTQTALMDDPSLTTRLWKGNNPVRLVVDMNLRLPTTLQLFDGSNRTIVFNSKIQEEKNNLSYYKIGRDKSLVLQISEALYRLNIQSALVEGGQMMLQSFIDERVYDEIRIITNRELHIPEGLPAPQIGPLELALTYHYGSDEIVFLKPKHLG